MISRLAGEIVEISGLSIVIDVHGVGYQVLCTRGLIAAVGVGEKAAIVIHTEVNENSIRLFGFEDALERQVFHLLMNVKGIGAKTASEVISAIDKRELLRAIGSGDLARLQAVKGVGKKTAERIIVELRDKVAEVVSELHPSKIEIIRTADAPFNDAVDALQALGFGRSDAEAAVQQVQRAGTFASGGKTNPGDIVREALRFV